MEEFVFSRFDDETDMWICENCQMPGARPPASVLVVTDGGEPDDAIKRAVGRVLTEVEGYIDAAGIYILDNYSRDYCRSLGIDEANLIDETPEAVSAAATLQCLTVFGPDGDTFELSFSLPWDEYHSYDVEFKDGEPTWCAVNG